MKLNFSRLLFIIALFLFFPFITRAGIWEQTNQVDFERGVLQGDLNITDNSVRLTPGVIYENAEDENIDEWRVFDNDPEGSITNIFNPELSSRVINLLSTDSVNSNLTGFDYGAPSKIVNGLKNVEWKMNTNTKSYIYVVVNTTLGTRSLNYGPYIDNGQNGIYIRYSLERENADGHWHTYDRNLENDLKAYEPDNDLINIAYFVARGNMMLDDIYFIPQNSTYTSPTLDLGENKVVSFNRIMWDGNTPEGSDLKLQTRTSVDGISWSEWSREYNNPSGENIDSPLRRYLQYRANFKVGSNITAATSLDRTIIEYNRTPSPTNNLLPINDRTLSDSDKLAWDVSSDPDPEDIITYTVELDNNNDFGSLDSVTSRINNAEININQLENFSNLEDDTRYYWRVKTVDNQNNQSDYSTEEKYFILDKGNKSPNPPISGFNPNQGNIVKTQKPTIYWNEALDPDSADTKDKLSYVIQIDKNDKFNSAYIYNTEKNKTNFTVPENLTDNTQYYYRIKTKDNENAESAWSEIQRFVLATGKSPIIAVFKTVGINKDNETQNSLLLGFTSNYISLSNLKFLYWPIIILIIAIAFFYLNKNILFNYILAPLYNKNSRTKKKSNNSLFANTIRSLDGVNSSKKVITETKGSHTKTIIAIIVIIGIIAIALAGIYYYDNNPSPYKDDGKSVKVGDELTYRIDFKNEGESTASNFNILDDIPTGTSYVANSASINGSIKTDIKDDDLVTFNFDKVKFEFGEITAKSSGYVTFKVKVEGTPENHKIENTADILYDENNGVQNTNQTINYIENEASSISSINGIVWNDANNNKLRDKNENGIKEITIRLYENLNNDNTIGEEDGAYLTETNTDLYGNYQFKNLIKGDYFIKIDEENLPDNSSIITDNNPQLIAIEKTKEYADINFGINSSNDQIEIEDNTPTPTGSIGNLVWMDKNSDGKKDSNEVGLKNISLKLYEDSNNNETLEFDQDLYVSTHKTDQNGNYKITGLSPKTYLILVEEDSLPSNNFNLTTGTNPIVVKLESDDQKYNDANFGYYIEDIINNDESNEVISENREPYVVSEIITSDQDYNKPNTISFIPTEIPDEARAGKISPPVLTHLGSAQIDNYDSKYSMPVDNDLVLKGKTGPNFTVTLFIHSDLNLKTVTSANQDGLWEMTVNTKLFEAGEHIVYAQSQDTENNSSAKVEIARFKINKDKKITEQFNYWIALGGLAIIAFTIILTTWIKERERNKNTTKNKFVTKPKKIKKTAKKVSEKPKSTRRKIKVK